MQTVNGQRRGVTAGGMVAAPTHGPNAAATQKRYIRHPAAGRMHAAPTMRGIRHTTHTRATAAFYRTANLIFSSGRRPRPTIIFHFYFLIFNFLRFLFFHFPSLFFVAFLTTSPTATAAAWRGAGAAGSLRSPAKWASPGGRRYRRRPGISPARTKRRLQLGATYYWQGAPPQG